MAALLPNTNTYQSRNNSMSTNTLGLNRRPFAERHAPDTVADLVHPEPERSRIGLYGSRQLQNSVMFFGGNGGGKTQTAETVIRDRRRLIGCLDAHIHRLACVDIDNACGPIFGSHNLMLVSEPDPEPYVHLEEIDQLPPKTQLRLAHAMDTMPGFRFIATTNNLAKVDPKLRSRCDCINIGPPQANLWLPRAQAILRSEGVYLPDAAILPLLNKDDVRDIVRDLEALVVRARAKQQTAAGPAASPSPVVGAPALTIVPGNSMVTTGSISLPMSTSLRILGTP